MSKESYARGFVKKAQACGVNPNDLLDFIKQSADQNALDEGVQEAMKNIADYAEKHPIGSGALAGGLSSVASGAQAGRALGGSVGGVAGSALAPVGALAGSAAGSSTDVGSGAGASAGSAGTVAGGSAVGGAIGAIPGAVAGSALAPVGSAVGASAGSSGATQKFVDMVKRERAAQQVIRKGNNNGIGKVVRNPDGSITETRRPLPRLDPETINRLKRVYNNEYRPALERLADENLRPAGFAGVDFDGNGNPTNVVRVGRLK